MWLDFKWLNMWNKMYSFWKKENQIVIDFPLDQFGYFLIQFQRFPVKDVLFVIE